MFIRAKETKNRKTGTVYVKHQLIESIRTDKGPRQRVVLELGRIDLDKSLWPHLASSIGAKIAGRESLFEQDPEIKKAADEAFSHYDFLITNKQEHVNRTEDTDFNKVDLTKVEVTTTRSLGPELVGNTFYEKLQFDEVFKSLGFSQKERSIAKAVIIARLIFPTSDLKTHSWIKAKTALLELLDDDISDIGKDPIYEIADKLLEHKLEIESSLIKSASNLFPTKRRLFLFDLTNTYFEGKCLGNELAKYGHSKEKRYDAKLVTLALVVDDRGLPIFSQIYGGNQSEPVTLKDVLVRLEALSEPDGSLFCENHLKIVMDRGIATKENIELLVEKNYPYIVISRQSQQSEYLEDFLSARDTFLEISDSNGSEVFLKKIETDDASRVLCLSTGRKDKEDAINASKSEKFNNDIEKLIKSIKTGRVSKSAKVSEKIGRIRQRHPSIAIHYDIELVFHEDHNKRVVRNGTRLLDKVIDLKLTKSQQKDDIASLSGCYVIETSDKDLEPEEIWKLYMTLTKVEDAFKSLKTDLGVRPVFHQLARRTEAHLFISVLAYHLLATIELTLRQKNDHRSFATIKYELSNHVRSTVILKDDKNRIHHVRCSHKPEPVHKEIYNILDIRDPLITKYRTVSLL